MNALIICPSARPAVAVLAETAPLAIVPLLGKCLLEYWLEELVGRGVKTVQIVAADRPREIAAFVGDGARWGMQVELEAEERESSAEEAEASQRARGRARTDLTVVMDHLPGRPGQGLLESYAGWFAGLQGWMAQAQIPERIGQYEIAPGVWVGLRTRINPTARLVAPCWLGDQVMINGEAVIGPGAMIEPGVIIGRGAQIIRSVIGPATFVGAQTRIENSLAHRYTLLNWTNNSCLRVPDACWLSSLRGPLCAERPAEERGAMKLVTEGHELQISGLGELSAANATPFMAAIRESLTTAATVIEVDLASTRFMDSCGLATLCSLHRITGALGIRLRLRRPRPALRQLFELTQLQEFFDIDGVANAAVVAPSERPQYPAAMISPEPPQGLIFE